jgi:hypothetical protein
MFPPDSREQLPTSSQCYAPHSTRPPSPMQIIWIKAFSGKKYGRSAFRNADNQNKLIDCISALDRAFRCTLSRKYTRPRLSASSKKNWWSRKSNVRKQRTIDDRATVRHLRTIVLGNCVIKAQVRKTSLGRGCDGQGTSRIVLTL